ncbi:polysaccharide biosynthesis/export family protein [Novosphingobium sp. ST904]|uniref:polysaccharide biosynthesis/export family protein n=1 Tax=Novosphingobium sp. ST904 TaxID=1684385 RepID=UPI0006CD9680|nr:polysaccharide biosynthesis/export family protein [Novosphingobium sp. ST904]KPH58049.1 hypothetical protein ADT71_26270 [Novosphingobium sp. ST904]TCM41533.1 polysaccharide export outer membrane protein [Novosphingobium sp. ST904]
MTPLFPRPHRISGVLGCAVLASLLASCARPDLPRDEAAYEVIPAVSPESGRDYILGPSDVISLTVLNEPDLSLKDVQITTGGNISLPLIGQVRASGFTTDGLASDIAARLGQRMLRNPDVSVNLTTAVSQKVVVEGSVTKPGIYPVQGRTTLLGAIAMAEGTSRISALGEIVILRTVDGKAMGAVFDVGMIRRGELPDPEILGGDTVVVGFSSLKAAWRDILTTAPLVAVFRAYR